MSSDIRTPLLIVQLFSGALEPFTFPANLKAFIEVPQSILGGEDVECLINDRDFIRDIGYDPHHVTVVGMRIPEAYDVYCWEDHWEAGLEGKPGHWLPEVVAHEERAVRDSFY